MGSIEDYDFVLEHQCNKLRWNIDSDVSVSVSLSYLGIKCLRSVLIRCSFGLMLFYLSLFAAINSAALRDLSKLSLAPDLRGNIVISGSDIQLHKTAAETIETGRPVELPVNEETTFDLANYLASRSLARFQSNQIRGAIDKFEHLFLYFRRLSYLHSRASLRIQVRRVNSFNQDC